MTRRLPNDVLIVGIPAAETALSRRLEDLGVAYTLVERTGAAGSTSPETDGSSDRELGTELVDAKWKQGEQRWQVRLATANGIELRKVKVLVTVIESNVPDMATQLSITGRDAQTLGATWPGYGQAEHGGTTVPGFPNLICLQHVDTGSNQSARMAAEAESIATYVTSCLAAFS